MRTGFGFQSLEPFRVPFLCFILVIPDIYLPSHSAPDEYAVPSVSALPSYPHPSVSAIPKTSFLLFVSLVVVYGDAKRKVGNALRYSI